MKDFKIARQLKIGTVFIWVGFVGAISFMEAWLKFQAPGIDLPLGLGIGRLVFKALNTVEITCAMVIILTLIYLRIQQVRLHLPWRFLIVVLILTLQTIWLLPALDARADLIINQQPVPDSKLHLLFVVLEIIKVLGLIFYGMELFKSENEYRYKDISK